VTGAFRTEDGGKPTTEQRDRTTRNGETEAAPIGTSVVAATRPSLVFPLLFVGFGKLGELA
jgi:hypothetical protein